MVPLANNEGFNARIPGAPRFSDGDVIEEDFELREEKSDIFAAKNFGHEIAAKL